MKEMWNNRYAAKEYAYGTEPNVFFKEVIDKQQKTGKILFAAEGEGRNAVYAATKLHDVTALDASDVGIAKTKSLAQEKCVHVKTICTDLNDFKFSEKYDVVMSSFMHLMEPLRSRLFKEMMNHLSEKGVFIGEFFSQKQFPRESGGPKNMDLLYTLDSFAAIFKEYEILLLEEIEIELDEGKHHSGTADVIRIFVVNRVEKDD